MRTAKEWARDVPTNVDSDEQCIPLVERIQLDAFKAGMTEAAKELRGLGKFHNSPSLKALLIDSAQTIEKARDSKTSV